MTSDLSRKQFLQGLAAASAIQSTLGWSATVPSPRLKRPRAIAMWDFSWLERRWPGAGYEDWDIALDELVERGYDAVRIDAYPHLTASDPEKSWLLKPMWEVQDWGAPTLVRVSVLPDLHYFLAKCRDRGIKVGLSTWFREDEGDLRSKISGPEHMAELWNKRLTGIRRAGLLDVILYVDLCNEWPGPIYAPFLKPALDWGAWPDPRAMRWMRTAIANVRVEFPELPLLFSTSGEPVKPFIEQDLDFIDAIDQHVWMASENGGEFYNDVGYYYQRFSEDGYHNIQLKAADLYASRSVYWRGLLTDKINALARAARTAKKSLMTTECWAIVDYKDWPMMPWDWVKDVCALGARTASATGQWSAIATSNFCGPQFRGMWCDVEWHRRLTEEIKTGPLDKTLLTGLLWARL